MDHPSLQVFQIEVAMVRGDADVSAHLLEVLLIFG